MIALHPDVAVDVKLDRVEFFDSFLGGTRIVIEETVRGRWLITSQGGGGGGFEGGCNFKTSPFLGGKIFTGKKHEGDQIL